MIEMLPSLVQAAAEGIKGSHLTILHGSEGVNEMVAGVVGQGIAIYDGLRKSVTTTTTAVEVTTNGHADRATAQATTAAGAD